MQGFVKAGTFRGVLKRNRRTLAEAKVVCFRIQS
jgi:hypothetical protein